MKQAAPIAARPTTRHEGRGKGPAIGSAKSIRLPEVTNIHQMKTVLSLLRLTSRFQSACIKAEKRINVKARVDMNLHSNQEKTLVILKTL